MKHLYSRYLRFYSFLFFITFTMLVFTACSLSTEEDEDKTYTIYTYSGTYDEFEENRTCLSISAIDKGKEDMKELSAENWLLAEGMIANYSAEKHTWTKESIRAYFLGWGLSAEKTEMYTKWLGEKDHVLFYKRSGDRSGDTMFYLIK